VLWVSYSDPQTARRRLVGVAQQVREQLAQSPTYTAPLPELQLPREERLRHGFWFMRFQDVDGLHAAHAELNKQPFRSHCGSLEGVIQTDPGSKPLDLRAIVQLEPRALDAVQQWLASKFGEYGDVTKVRLPRLKCNWDGGLAFVHYRRPEEAYQALRNLDGTPSCVSGCNMFVDFAEEAPLWRGPGVAGRR